MMTLHTNQPFHDVLFDRLLAKDMKERGDVDFNDAKHAFKRVAVVGMLFPTKPQFKGTGFPMPDELLHDDKSMVHQTLKSFSDAGIPTSPNVEFDVYNLLPPIASDFLQSANPQEGQAIQFPNVDLVIVNYVPKHGFTQENWEDYNIREGFDELKLGKMCSMQANGKLVSVSQLHRMDGIWPQASFNVESKFIATHGGTGDEVTTEEFKEHENVRVLIDTKILQAERREQGQYGRVMGVVANVETLADFVPHTKKNSAIGAAIHKVSQLRAL